MSIHIALPPSPEFETVARGALFRDRIAIPVRAAPDDIFRALEDAPLSEKKLAWVMGELRYLPLPQRRCLSVANSQATRLSTLRNGSALILLNDVPREIIVGSAGRLHGLMDHTPVWFDSRDEFDAFDHPAYQKLFMGFRAVATGRSGKHWIVLEHATRPLSRAAERRFKRYWSVIRPVSAFVARDLLREIARHATRAGLQNSPRNSEDIHAHVLSG